MGAALSQVMQQERFQREAEHNRDPEVKRLIWRLALRWGGPILGQMLKYLLIANPEKQIAEFKRRFQQVLDVQKVELQERQGEERVTYIEENVSKMLFIFSFLPSVYCIVVGWLAKSLLSQFSKRWLGDDAEIDSLVEKLNLSLPGNITSEMGLAIGDIADVIRNYPEVLEYLPQANDKEFYKGLDFCEGGEVVRRELDAFMERYGMRGPGEIDMARPRWREAPTGLVSPLLSHIRSVKPEEHRQRFAAGEKEAQKAEEELLQRVSRSFAGGLKSRWFKRLIRCFRYYFGYREYPKYMIIQLFWYYKQALLAEGERLVKQRLLTHAEDLFYLSLSEFKQLVAGLWKGDVQALVATRKEEMASHAKLVPPRVITSEGEALNGEYSQSEAPAGALLGMAVSTGIVEGRARVVQHPEEAELHTGDILVAPFTDPGWTPLFQSAAALVMEVGGMMTHGSVVAREYGIPAVVSVEQATKRIQDGQWIRVNGVEGYVEILNKDPMNQD